MALRNWRMYGVANWNGFNSNNSHLEFRSSSHSSVLSVNLLKVFSSTMDVIPGRCLAILVDRSAVPTKPCQSSRPGSWSLTSDHSTPLYCSNSARRQSWFGSMTISQLRQANGNVKYRSTQYWSTVKDVKFSFFRGEHQSPPVFTKYYYSE